LARVNSINSLACQVKSAGSKPSILRPALKAWAALTPEECSVAMPMPHGNVIERTGAELMLR
jgi:hypothetical protein